MQNRTESENIQKSVNSDLQLTHHGDDYRNRILCGREMFLYWKNVCHNPYSIGPLGAIELVVVAAEAKAVGSE